MESHHLQGPKGGDGLSLRTGTNTLATPDNLARWGKPVDTKCHMEGCNAISTLGHLLSSCPKSLDRYSFRHDSVLSRVRRVGVFDFGTGRVGYLPKSSGTGTGQDG